MIIFGIVMFFMPPAYYSITVYSIIVFFSLLKLSEYVYDSILLKKENLCDGILVEKERLNNSDLSEVEYKIHVEFESPLNGQRFIISKEIKEGFLKEHYKILFNSQNPLKSRLILGAHSKSILFFSVLLLFFGILLIREFYK